MPYTGPEALGRRCIILDVFYVPSALTHCHSQGEQVQPTREKRGEKNRTASRKCNKRCCQELTSVHCVWGVNGTGGQNEHRTTEDRWGTKAHGKKRERICLSVWGYKKVTDLLRRSAAMLRLGELSLVGVYGSGTCNASYVGDLCGC